jgi:hypothetical protein
MNDHTKNVELPPLSPEESRSRDLSILSTDRLNDFSPEFTALSAAIVEMLKQGDSVNREALQVAWVQYAEITESYIDSLEDTPETPDVRRKAQITAIIHKALLFEQAGNVLRYLEELDYAEEYAANSGFDEVSSALLAEIAEKSN